MALCIIGFFLFGGTKQSVAASQNPFQINDVINTSAGQFFVYDIQADGRTLFMACGADGFSAWSSTRHGGHNALAKKANEFALKFSDIELACMEERGDNYFSKLLPLDLTDITGMPESYNNYAKNADGILRYVVNDSGCVLEMGDVFNEERRAMEVPNDFDPYGYENADTWHERYCYVTEFWTASVQAFTTDYLQAYCLYRSDASCPLSSAFVINELPFVPAFTIPGNDVQKFANAISALNPDKPNLATKGSLSISVKDIKTNSTLTNITFNVYQNSFLWKENASQSILDFPAGEYAVRQKTYGKKQ